MKWLIGAILLSSSLVSAAEGSRYSAGYEVKLVDAKSDTYQVQTQSRFARGEPLRIDIGPHVVLLAVEELPKNRYQLLLSVKGAGPGVGGTILTKKFDGEFGSILEFKAANQLVQVEGALALGIIP